MVQFILLTTFIFLVTSSYPQFTSSFPNNNPKQNLSILAVLPSAYGHAYPIVELLRELSSRGHQTTLLLLTCPGFKIDLPPNVNIMYHPLDEGDCDFFKNTPKAGMLNIFLGLSTGRILKMWNTIEVLELLSSYLQANKVDVVLCDPFTSGAVSITRNISIPSIVVDHHIDRYIPSVSYIPSFFSYDTIVPLTYIKRIQNFILSHTLYFYLMSYFYEYPLVSVCSMLNIELVRYADLVIVTSEFGLLVPRDIPPFVKVVGPLFSEKRQTPDPEISRILDTAQDQGKKVIYVSMGTIASLDRNQLSHFVEGMRGLNNTLVLWAISNENQRTLLPPEIPEHVIIKPHMPQVYILNHPAVKLFVSHCGANSALEAIWVGIPVLAVPYMGDQFGIAAKLTQRGMALLMPVSDLDSAEFTKMVNHLLNSENYLKKAKKMSNLVRTSGGLEEATYHVERIGALGVTEFFVPERLNVSWFVRNHLDIYLTFLVVAVLFWKCLRYCCSCRGFNKNEKLKIQ
jgi:hypothetical protein